MPNNDLTKELKDDMRACIRVLQRRLSAYHDAVKRAEGYSRQTLAEIQDLRRQLGE